MIVSVRPSLKRSRGDGTIPSAASPAARRRQLRFHGGCPCGEASIAWEQSSRGWDNGEHERIRLIVLDDLAWIALTCNKVPQ